MTLEELKVEAKKHGYKLAKDRPHIRMSPCICGNKNIAYMSLWGTPTPYFHQCHRCEFKSTPCKTKYEAKLKWNECVEKALKEYGND